MFKAYILLMMALQFWEFKVGVVSLDLANKNLQCTIQFEANGAKLCKKMPKNIPQKDKGSGSSNIHNLQKIKN
jgi:hypothetical protein